MNGEDIMEKYLKSGRKDKTVIGEHENNDVADIQEVGMFPCSRV